MKIETISNKNRFNSISIYVSSTTKEKKPSDPRTVRLLFFFFCSKIVCIYLRLHGILYKNPKYIRIYKIKYYTTRIAFNCNFKWYQKHRVNCTEFHRSIQHTRSHHQFCCNLILLFSKWIDWRRKKIDDASKFIQRFFGQKCSRSMMIIILFIWINWFSLLIRLNFEYKYEWCVCIYKIL